MESVRSGFSLSTLIILQVESGGFVRRFVFIFRCSPAAGEKRSGRRLEMKNRVQTAEAQAEQEVAERLIL